MSDPQPEADRLKWLAEILTPTGILVGLLYYFGYVTTDAWFRYFGLELSHVELSQQAIVLQSIAALYLPVGALLVLGLCVHLARRAVDSLLSRGWRPTVMRKGGAIAVIAGSGLLIRALVGVFVPDIARTEPLATSPLSLCAGVHIVVGGVDVIKQTGKPNPPPLRPFRLKVLIGAVVVLGLFWATNSVAAAYGRGRAVDFARTLPDRAGVVLDTPERLFLVSGDVEETKLSTEGNATYRYRYRNLRLLAASHGRVYLAPANWQIGDGTVIVLPDDRVRLQFLR